MKWTQVNVEWNWAVFKLDGRFKHLFRDPGDTFTNFLMAKSFVGGALFHTPCGEMNLASSGSDNNIGYFMKRFFNHYGLISRFVKLITTGFEDTNCPGKACRLGGQSRSGGYGWFL